MKTKKNKLVSFITAITVFIFLISCVKENNEKTLPILTTTEITAITGNTAKSGGVISDDGGSTVTERGVCWSIDENPTVTDNKTIDGAGGGSFTSSLINLDPGTQYFVRAYATSANGTGYGMAYSFNTSVVGPTVITKEIINITDISAIGGGEIISDGASTITARGVCWHTSPNPTLFNSYTSDGVGIGTYSSNITGLIPGKKYYIRAYATNSISTVYGNLIEFITNSGKPAVSTLHIIKITGINALCWGKVINDGGETILDKGFVWSTSENPTINNNSGITHDGLGLGVFTSTITNLIPKTKYFIKAYATNITGTSYGVQLEFTTNSWIKLSNFSGAGRDWAFSFVHDNFAYVGGGTYTPDIWKYHYLTDTWTYVCDIPFGSPKTPFAFVVNGKAYITTNDYSNGLWEYDILNNSWQQKSTCTNTLYQYSFSLNNKGYVLGFVKNNSNTMVFNEYNPVTDTWISKSVKSCLSFSRPIFFVKNNKAYVGIDREARQIFTYDVSNDTWAYETTFPGVAWSSTCYLVIGDYAYIIGGNSGSSQELWQYNLNTKSWQQLENMPELRSESVSFVINSIGYYGTGEGVPGENQDFWKFIP